jgi:hypothetical protein
MERFAQAEAQISLDGIGNENTEFYSACSALLCSAGRITEAISRRHSRTLANRRTTPNFWGASGNCLARWRLSTLSGTAPTSYRPPLHTRLFSNLLLLIPMFRRPGTMKLTQQTSAAALVYTTATGRLFITDESTKQRVLIDTGLDLCVFPRKLILQRKERVNYGASCTSDVQPHLPALPPCSTGPGW